MVALPDVIAEDEDALRETVEDELIEEVVWATEEFEALTVTPEDELIELVVRETDEFDVVNEAVETGTEEFDMEEEVADMLVRGAELLVTAVVPFCATDDEETLDLAEDEDEVDPVVRTTLLVVEDEVP